MAALISAICGALVILAFCQIIIEAILPEGGTKRYVLFITGLVAVVVIVSAFTMKGPDIIKTVYSKTAEMNQIAENGDNTGDASMQTNPYQQYIVKLIDTYR